MTSKDVFGLHGSSMGLGHALTRLKSKDRNQIQPPSKHPKFFLRDNDSDSKDFEEISEEGQDGTVGEA